MLENIGIPKILSFGYHITCILFPENCKQLFNPWCLNLGNTAVKNTFLENKSIMNLKDNV